MLQPTPPRFLWFLTLTYSMILMLSNWFEPRLISIGGINSSSGTLIFPFTFLLSDLITEVYGYKHARRAIWCGFLFNAVFFVYGQIVIHLPSPTYATNNALFDKILAANTRMIIGSCISYLMAEPFNSFIMSKLKIKMQGRFVSVRFVSSTIVSAGIDTSVFCAVAFFGTMSNANLLHFIMDMWIIKIMFEVIGLPISIYLVAKLKQVEQIDIYDRTTNFNVFSLNVDYSEKDNKFRADPANNETVLSTN